MLKILYKRIVSMRIHVPQPYRMAFRKSRFFYRNFGRSVKKGSRISISSWGPRRRVSFPPPDCVYDAWRHLLERTWVSISTHTHTVTHVLIYSHIYILYRYSFTQCDIFMAAWHPSGALLGRTSLNITHIEYRMWVKQQTGRSIAYEYV